MLYRNDKYGKPVSQLGYGCMRFTKKGAVIDYEKAKREIMLAIEKGVNYFDTAYLYPGSEDCLGRILEEEKCRDKVYIATKLPHYLMRSAKAIERTFDEQLKRLRTDYVDYYLMHMFTAPMEWDRLCKLGIREWFDSHKSDGSIGNIGFSFHGDTDSFIEILNAYDWDFCQIQYNYLDETSQAGRRGLEAAREKGIPVFIMEPLRGGKLVNIPEKAWEALSASGCGFTPAELALRWLWDQKGVTCILSGMNSESMVAENCRIASEAKAGSFTSKERELVETVKKIIKENEKVGCTGCQYCMPCPAGVDIPGNFYFYNLMYLEKKGSARREFLQNMALRGEPGFASKCIGCGKCESQCSQNIAIRDELKKADRQLRPVPYRIAVSVVRKLIRRKR